MFLSFLFFFCACLADDWWWQDSINVENCSNNVKSSCWHQSLAFVVVCYIFFNCLYFIHPLCEVKLPAPLWVEVWRFLCGLRNAKLTQKRGDHRHDRGDNSSGWQLRRVTRILLSHRPWLMVAARFDLILALSSWFWKGLLLLLLSLLKKCAIGLREWSGVEWTFL